MPGLIIAIDGPSGAGKGTIARAVARALDYRHVDTGAMYRAVGWKATERGVSLDDESAVAALARDSVFGLDDNQVTIDGSDVTAAIRTPQMDRAAAAVARLAAVRATLVGIQRKLAADGGVVMEGRDIGTAVFPDADIKVYLDASAEERARRRANDPAHRGADAQADVAREMQVRDASDRTRAASPLTVAPDAIVIDTTGMPVADVVERVMALVRAKLPAAAPER